MILVKRMSPMIMLVRAAAVLHRYFDITLDSRLDPIIAEHTYLFSVVKCENEIRVSFLTQDLVRPGGSLDFPPVLLQSSQYTSCSRALPTVHAAAKVI